MTDPVGGRVGSQVGSRVGTAGAGSGSDQPIVAVPVVGMGEVHAGDDVAAVLLAALAAGGHELVDGDVLVVSSKILSKAEGRSVQAHDRDAAVQSQTVRLVAQRSTPRGPARIVESAAGPVMAGAGVDASNVAPGQVLLLPVDSDASARRLRAGIRQATGRVVAVVVSDTLGRPWREGQVDAAIGVAGLRVVDDLRGGVDAYGNDLSVTVRAVADEVASLGDLVKGKLTGVPVALVRGLAGWVQEDDGPGATALLRPAASDWFRLGHIEAVQAALGVDPQQADPLPVVPDGLEQRVQRVLALALGRRLVDPATEVTCTVEVRTGAAVGAVAQALVTLSASLAAAGALAAVAAVAERVAVAAWTEGLTAVMAGASEVDVDGLAAVAPTDAAAVIRLLLR